MEWDCLPMRKYLDGVKNFACEIAVAAVAWSIPYHAQRIFFVKCTNKFRGSVILQNVDLQGVALGFI